MCGAVIVMTPFESAVRGSLEGSRGGRTHVHCRDDHGDRATPLSGTQLLAEVSRRSTAEATARELVLSDLLVMPQGQPSESSPSTDLIDPSGMPTDQSHPLWGDLEDDRVSPSEFQKRRAAWMQSLQTL